MGPAQQELHIPLLFCIGIILSVVCVPSGAAADVIALISQSQTATATAGNSNFIHQNDWEDLYRQPLQDTGFGPADNNLALHSLVGYEPPYVLLLNGATLISAQSNLSSEFGTNRRATASEGSTLILLMISAVSIALIILRNRYRGTNRSQDSGPSAGSPRESHLTNSYEAYSPHAAPKPNRVLFRCNTRSSQADHAPGT